VHIWSLVSPFQGSSCLGISFLESTALPLRSRFYRNPGKLCPQPSVPVPINNFNENCRE
jgi:hypothetical protein